MLTDEQKQHRVQWAKKYQADDWYRTIFTDESSFHSVYEIRFEDDRKISESEVKRIPKNRRKVSHLEKQSVSKTLLIIIRLGQISLVFILSILLNPIFSLVAQCNLNSGGEFNKIMTYQRHE